MSLAAEPGFIYGIDIPRFLDTDDDGIGDLEGVRRRLPYVQWLGATWIWLLPFYDSPRRDNGYDVRDHRRVDPRFGDLDDVRRLIDTAHSLGLRVLVDLVVHHASIDHPWFRSAVAGDEAAARRFVWGGPPKPPEDEPNIFPGEEESVWAFQPEVGRYYHHLFYWHQPDLNLAERTVVDELLETVEFWTDQGVDGFRLDAAPHAVSGATPGRAGIGFFDEIRARAAAVNPNVVLVGEVDVTAEEFEPYVHPGRFDGLFAFDLSRRLFLAMSRGRTNPQQIVRHSSSAWVTFLRNADELDLDFLTEGERQEIFDAFAPEPDMRVFGRGIRRALWPMLGSDEAVGRAFEALFGLPGLPLVMAGQEIGLGEDLSLPGREAVRLTMQWNDGPCGGFTADAGSELVRPVQHDGERDWHRTSVAAQSGDPRSLTNRLRAVVVQRNSRLSRKG